MSREFGSYEGGYFHQQIDTAASDCAEGRDELTRLWGEVLREFHPIAYAISSSEASDRSEEHSIATTARHLEFVEEKVARVREYIDRHPAFAMKAVIKRLK